MLSRSQIIATIGPATKDFGMLRDIIAAGVDVARLNFSWGTYEEHALYVAELRKAGEELGKQVSIIQDLSGPRVQNENGHGFDATSTRVITEKDLQDLDFGLSQNVEYVCMSFVGNAHDVEDIRSEIAKRNGTAKVIAKIERQEALDDLEAIVDAADAIMIGRGDLGQSIPLEKLPFVEEEIILLCKKKKKPVITATQMLLSMMENSEPTRAEVTDVAYAILLGSDAVMLSEETARGKYPLEAVKMMERIVREAEQHVHPLVVYSL